MKQKRKHLVFWIVYSLFIFFIFSVLTNLWESAFRMLGIISMQMLVFYLNYNVLISKYYANKKYVQYSLANICLLLFSVFVIDFLIRFSYFLVHFNRDHSFSLDTIFNFNYFNIDSLEIVFNHMMPILLAIFISFLFYNFIQQKKREEKEALLIKAEKNFLVSQINPHFLFNTLNNIYSLTLLNDAKGSEAVLQLSRMLDYSLYSGTKEIVNLEKDIQYITNFIDLFKLKDDEIDTVSFNYSNANQKLKIAPMLLIPFVENAFKHGNIEDVTKGVIAISIETKGNMILFECKNSFVEKKSVDKSSGIGIANVKRRLELLYPNDHHLEIKSDENNFIVTLSITTSYEV